MSLLRALASLPPNRQPVTTPQQAEATLKQAKSGGNVLLLVNRHGTDQYLALSTSNQDNG